jgi:septum formation inhibitor MinC
MQTEFITQLFSSLWQEYSNRVSYAHTYQQMITEVGGTVANDHIAFRSLRLSVDSPQGKINLGIEYLDRLFTNLGYIAVNEYTFTQTHLYARHYQHSQRKELDLPKLFISELIVDELPDSIAQLIQQTVNNSPQFVKKEELTFNQIQLIKKIFSRPWQPPKLSVIKQVNEITQYGAWVLLHGYAVNHFTGYVNRQNTTKYPDIDSTARGLANLGIPMKAEIEGNITCGLRQTATQAVKELVTVIDDESNLEIQIPWTYAYYEIAQRYPVEITPGNYQLFDGFFTQNAQQLFEMTRLPQESIKIETVFSNIILNFEFSFVHFLECG